jgi:hypothetical protein
MLRKRLSESWKQKRERKSRTTASIEQNRKTKRKIDSQPNKQQQHMLADFVVLMFFAQENFHLK